MTVKVRIVTIDLTAISTLMEDEIVELKAFDEKCVVSHMTTGELSHAVDFYAGHIDVMNRYCHMGNNIMLFGSEDQIIQYILLP